MSSKQLYEWYKAHHICAKCGQQQAQSGYIYCLECRMKAREQNEKYRRQRSTERNSELRAYWKKWRTETYQKRKEAGLCPRCGKRRPPDGKVQCRICTAKKRKMNERYRRRKGQLPSDMLDGITRCANCGNKGIVSGKKLCQRCYRNSLKAIKAAQKHSPKNNYFALENDARWRKQKIIRKKYGYE